MNAAVIRCEECASALEISGSEISCNCGKIQYSMVGGIYVNEDLKTTQDSEMLTRDKQAAGYLKHAKFPTQVASLCKWLKEIGVTRSDARVRGIRNVPKMVALDLGCGPGPYTKKLQDLGFYVVAIDFSYQSLKINSSICGQAEVAFIQEDLNKLSLVKNSVDLVVMADFLQHLGGKNQRERLLHEVFGALKKNGCFYLSFFNLNIKNYIKGDVHGGFADGNIPYERLTAKNVISYFPKNISVDRVRDTLNKSAFH